MEKQSIIQARQFADWAAPILPVVKRDCSVRICGDYKVTANRATKVNAHPIPSIKELFTAMSGGVSFTKLDLSHAYFQLQLDE